MSRARTTQHNTTQHNTTQHNTTQPRWIVAANERGDATPIRQNQITWRIKLQIFIARVIGLFVPSRIYRRKLRHVARFGFCNYLFTYLRARISNPEKNFPFPYYLAVVAIAKNEAAYFKEWLEYHRLVGVEKFYIYDNESNDNTREILQPYIERGIVEYAYVPGVRMQMPAYNDAVAKHKFHAKWLAVIDLDEFIVPIAAATISDFLRALPADVSQLVIGGVFYGDNGHQNQPDGLVIENFQRRANDKTDRDIYGAGHFKKSIVNPRMAADMRVHQHLTVCRSVDENHSVIDLSDDFSARLPMNKIRLNHYYCKSWAEHARRAERGDVFYGQEAGRNKYTKAMFAAHNCNEIFDPIMNKYVEAIKRAISD